MNSPIHPPHAEGPLPSAPPPRTGTGTRLTVNDLGHTYSAPPRGGTFDHPFRPALAGMNLRLSPGIVDTFIPLIDGQPMNGAGGKPAPLLELDAADVNADGTSWCVLEVVPNAQGVLDKNSRIELIHTGDASKSKDPNLGRKPITLLLWRAGRPVQVIAAVRFCLLYFRVIPTAGGGVVQHLFL
jgi:hypothetical protein